MTVDDSPVLMVPLAQMHDDPACMVRVAHAPEAIERYKEIWAERPAEMEPLLLGTRTHGGGYTVIAGYGRREAAIRAGLERVPARIVTVSPGEAVLLACQSNARHGQPLSAEDVGCALRLLEKHHPQMSVAGLARAVGRSTRVVRHWRRAERVRSALHAGGVQQELSPAVLDEIGAAPEEYWAALGKAAAARSWTKWDARLAVENLADPRFSEAAKHRLLEGVQPPAVVPAYEGRALARALAPEVLEALSAEHLVAIEIAPPRYWEELAAKAAAGQWPATLTERLAKSLLGATPEQAQQILCGPQLAGGAVQGRAEPVIVPRPGITPQGPAHLDPGRARTAIRQLFKAVGAAQRFDPDLAMGAFEMQEWEDLARGLASVDALAQSLRAALDRLSTDHPRTVARHSR